ncbi:unnamed protein product [Callosobruchus maculatus]|nr:unnamed protein product [Callosobruchus maculatus]
MHRFLSEKICIFVTQNHHFFDKVDSILWVENGAVVKRSPDTVSSKNEQLEENISLYKHSNTTVSHGLITVYNFTLTLYSCLILGTVVLSVISAILLFNFTRAASNKLHNLMVKSMMGAVMYFHDIIPIGSIINRFSKDLTVIDEQLPFVVYDLLEILFSFCGVVILLAYVNLLFLIPVSVIVTIMYFMRKIYIPAGRNLQRMDMA